MLSAYYTIPGMCFGGGLFILALIFPFFNVNIGSIYTNIFVYIGLIFFMFCGFLTVLNSVNACIEANNDENE